ncbi:MAG: hypothetical protein AB1805_00715 [Nitrospirota bacterium]
MKECDHLRNDPGPSAREVYYKALTMANKSKVPYLVGGAYALKSYTGISRDTKDLDLFARPGEVEALLKVFSSEGYETEITSEYWLGKIFFGNYFIDVIFNSGNGTSVVDDEWFAFAGDDEILGIPVRICPAEEIIVQKAFIKERERYDGADVAHLLRALAERLDWDRLLRRFEPHWQVLLVHLILFGFIYPSERHRIPRRILRELLDRQEHELSAPPDGQRICRGPFLSRTQYRIDIECWGYKDPVQLVRTW